MAADLLSLTDIELKSALHALRENERETTIDILLHLNEMERRKLHVEDGYPSLFSYLTARLRYSESGANRRIRSARCVREFPEVLDLLRSGEVTITTVSIFASILTKENVATVLHRVMNKTQREVERFVALYQPPKKVKESMTPVKVVIAQPRPLSLTLDQPTETKSEFVLEQQLEPHSHNGGDSETREVVGYKVQFLLKGEAVEDFEEARSLMSHLFPNGVSLEEALGLGRSVFAYFGERLGIQLRNKALEI